MIINEHLSRSNHAHSKHHKENKCYYITLETLYRETSTYAHLEACYKLMIQPIIEYAPTVWASHLQRDILNLLGVTPIGIHMFHQ